MFVGIRARSSASNGVGMVFVRDGDAQGEPWLQGQFQPDSNDGLEAIINDIRWNFAARGRACRNKGAR